VLRHQILKRAQCGISTCAGGNHDLLIMYIRHITGGKYTTDTRLSMTTDLDFATPVGRV